MNYALMISNRVEDLLSPLPRGPGWTQADEALAYESALRTVLAGEEESGRRAWVGDYVLVGWFNGYLDKYYVDSWRVWFSIVLVFNGLGNVALAVMRYRAGEKGLLPGLLENFKWTLMLAIFLGGLSLHVSQALLAHMFGIDMSWGASSKEAEFSNFFIEVPKVLRNVSLARDIDTRPLHPR